MKTGIDISHNNGHIDWSKVTADFVYMKLNTGVNAIDPLVHENSLGATANRKLFGYYHWATLNKVDVVSDATAEAQDCISTLATLPKYSLITALDIEEDNVLHISPASLELWITTFCKEMAKANHRVMLYSYISWLNTNLPHDHKLGTMPLWLAEYITRPTPYLPYGFSKYDIWQYSEHGTHPGITGEVDLNRSEDLTPIMA